METLKNDTGKLRNEIAEVQRQLINLQFKNINESQEELERQHLEIEKRLRIVENGIIKFDFILYLTMGGGLVGLINLGLLAFTLLRAMKP